MTTSSDKFSDQEIASEAYAWLAQIETGGLSSEDRAAFREWMNRSPRHAAEIRAVAALSEELNVLTELFSSLAAETGAKTQRQFVSAMWARVAALLALIIIGAVIYANLFQETTTHKFYATEIGEYRTVELDDGSTIKLNTNSAVEVTYGSHQRVVRLAKGEAFFDVEKDPARPFIVYAGDNIARAVGTAFSVRLYNDKTELIVTEGIVEFAKLPSTVNLAAKQSRGDESASTDVVEPVLVTSGYELFSTQSRSEPAQKLSKAAQQSKLSWTEGLFDFSDTTLSEVVSEVSRHTTLHIEIKDATLRDVKFGGVFRVGDVETLLDALPSVGVTVERVNKNEVLLYSAKDT